MKKLIIIILILLIIGLYYYTAETKVFMQKTGNVVKEKIITLGQEGKEYIQETVKNEEEPS